MRVFGRRALVDKKKEILSELLESETAQKLLIEHEKLSSDIDFGESLDSPIFEALKALAFATDAGKKDAALVRWVNQKLETINQEG